MASGNGAVHPISSTGKTSQVSSRTVDVDAPKAGQTGTRAVNNTPATPQTGTRAVNNTPATRQAGRKADNDNDADDGIQGGGASVPAVASSGVGIPSPLLGIDQTQFSPLVTQTPADAIAQSQLLALQASQTLALDQALLTPLVQQAASIAQTRFAAPAPPVAETVLTPDPLSQFVAQTPEIVEIIRSMGPRPGLILPRDL